LCSPHIRYIALPLFLVDILTTVIYTLSLHDALPIAKLTLEEKAIARSFFLLTSKPTIFACNVAESDLAAVAGIDDAGRGQVPKSHETGITGPGYDAANHIVAVQDYARHHFATEAIV